VSEKEEVVGSLSPVLRGEESNNIEADDSDCAPDGKRKFYRMGERPVQGPFVN